MTAAFCSFTAAKKIPAIRLTRKVFFGNADNVPQISQIEKFKG
jgi:hypothetical protein